MVRVWLPVRSRNDSGSGSNGADSSIAFIQYNPRSWPAEFIVILRFSKVPSGRSPKLTVTEPDLSDLIKWGGFLNRLYTVQPEELASRVHRDTKILKGSVRPQSKAHCYRA